MKTTTGNNGINWRKLILVLIGILIIIFLISSTITAIGIVRVLHQPASTKKEVYPTYPKVNYGTGQQAALIKRGEYLAKIGDCIACHTAKYGGKAFAGGYPMQTPFGTIYTPNLTPDKQTGIGAWSNADFIKAMREGISPHGYYYYPAFPYLYFTRLSKRDLLSIRAYLNAIPAVHHVNKENDMVWPFNIRFLQLGWRILFFDFDKQPQLVFDKTKSAAWNRGHYIVEGLGHCAMCHTPSYHIISPTFSLGAPIRKYNLTGAKIQGYLAPNITHSNFKNVPDSEIINVFKHNKLVGGGNVQGPMLEANRDSLSYLKHSDLKAIAVYLKSVKSEMPKLAGGSHKGKAVYETYCSACHSTGAAGAPKYGNVADWQPRLKLGLKTLVHNAIHGINAMPAKGTCLSCTDQQIHDAVAYMVASVEGKKAEPGTSYNHALEIKPLTIADGKTIYQQAHCAVCHNGNYPGAPKLGDKAAWNKIANQGFLTILLHATKGYDNHPPMGSCSSCTNAQMKAAVKYMLKQGVPNKNYSLW